MGVYDGDVTESFRIGESNLEAEPSDRLPDELDEVFSKGSLAQIHEEKLAELRQREALLAAHRSGKSVHSQAAVAKGRHSIVQVADKGRYQMLTYKVSVVSGWRKRKKLTAYLGVGRGVDHKAMLLLERSKTETLSFDLGDVTEVLRLRKTTRVRFSVPGANAPTETLEVEFQTEMEANEAFAALTADRDRRAPRQVQLCTSTWNMGDVAPDERELPSLLPPGADAYVVGVQECSYKTVAGYGSSVDHLCSLLLAYLNGGDRILERVFVDVATATVGSIHLVVLCSAQVRPYIS